MSDGSATFRIDVDTDPIRAAANSAGRSLFDRLVTAARDGTDEAEDELRQFARRVNRIMADAGKGSAVLGRGITDAQRKQNALALTSAKVAGQRMVSQERGLQSRLGIEAQRAAQVQITQARVAGQRRVAITRGVIDALGRLERLGAQAAVGAARTATSAVGNIWRGTVGSLRRTFHERQVIISGGLRNETRIFTQHSQQIQRIQEQSRKGLIGGLRGGGLLGGIGAGFGIGALGNLGFQRAADIENIQKRLNVLLDNNTFQARALFLQMAAFARTTAFDLTGVADLGSRLLAANISAEDILPNIKALAGAITLVGGTTDDLNGIARALGQITSVGKLTAEEMNQISERLPGINITQLFSDALGFESTAAFIKAREAGEITGEAAVAGFFNAIKGDPRFAQALAEGANSFSNLRANAIESFADIGAAFFERFEGPIKAGLRSTTNAFASLATFIRGGSLSEGMELLRVVLGKVALALAGIVAAKGAIEVLGLLGRGVGLLLTPMGLLAATLTAASAAFLFFFQRSESFRNIVLELRDRAVAFGRQGLQFLVDRFDDLRDALQPTISRLQAFAGRLVTVFRAVQAAFQQGGLSGALRSLTQNVGVLFRELLSILQPLAQRAGELVSNFVNAVRDRIIDGFRAINFGAIGSFLLNAISNSIVQVGIGAAIGGVLGGPLGAALGAALVVAARFAIPRLREAFSGIDIAQVFGGFLKKVKELGRLIGQIISSREFILGVAGIAAAAAAIAVQFVSGFVSGILANLGDIRSAGATLLEALFNAPSVLKSVLALAILFRNGLRSVFSGTFKSEAQKIGTEVGKSLGQGVVQGADQATATLGQRLKAKMARIGSQIGSALALGTAAALSGSALGSAQSGLEQGLGLASLGGSIAAATAAFGPAGGVGAAGIGLLTTAMSANAKAAQEARDRMLGFKDAIEQTGSVAGGLGAELSGNLDQFGALRDVLVDAGFTVQQFEDAFARGESDEFIKQVGQRIAETTGSIVDATAVTSLLERAIEDVDAAAKELDLEGALTGDRAAREAALRDTNAFRDALIPLAGAARDAARAKRQLFLEQQAGRLNEVLEGVRNRAQEIGDKADESRRKLRELLTPSVETPAAATNAAVTSLPSAAQSVQEGLALGVGSALGSATVAQALAQFGTDAGIAFETGLTSSTDPEKIKGALGESLFSLTAAIGQLDVPQETKDKLKTELDATFATATDQIPVGVEIVQEEARAAGLEATSVAVAAAVAAGGITLDAAADILAAANAGKTIQFNAQTAIANSPVELNARGNAVSASAAGTTIFANAKASATADNIVISNISADTSAAFRVGSSIASGVAAGVRASARVVIAEVGAMARGAIGAATSTLQSSSPSKVFIAIGKDITDGLVRGIRDGSDSVISAISSIADRLTQVGSNLAVGIRQGLGSVFSQVFAEARIFSGGGQQQAVAGLTTALGGILEQVASNAEAIWAAAAKPAGERSLAERLMLGESFTSFRVGDDFGVANRGAITSAVDAILEVGEALLAQGFTAEATAARLRQYRAQVIATARTAGLAVGDVEAFVNSLGLSNAGLVKFVQDAQKLQAVVREGQSIAGTGGQSPLTPGPNPVGEFINFEPGAVQVYPVTDDPEFVALTTVNAVVRAVRL